MESKILTLNEPPRHGGGAPLHDPRRRRSLLLWSGGVDSTYGLVRLLRMTQDQVFTHHVRFTGMGAERCAFEHAAIKRLRAWLGHHERCFAHTTSSLDLSELSGRGADTAILAFMAAQAAMSHGLTPFDRILIGVNGDRDPGWDPDSAACALRRARMARALRAAWGCDEVPQIYLWLPRPCRAQMIAMLGPGLLALTVSCLQPAHRQCGDVRNAGTDRAANSVPAAGIGREGALQACGRCTKCRMDAHPASQHRERGRDDGDSDSNGDEQQPNGDAVRDAAARTPRLFHHLEQLSNKTQGLLRAAATSDPPVP